MNRATFIGGMSDALLAHFPDAKVNWQFADGEIRLEYVRSAPPKGSFGVYQSWPTDSAGVFTRDSDGQRQELADQDIVVGSKKLALQLARRCAG